MSWTSAKAYPGEDAADLSTATNSKATGPASFLDGTCSIVQIPVHLGLVGIVINSSRGILDRHCNVHEGSHQGNHLKASHKEV